MAADVSPADHLFPDKLNEDIAPRFGDFKDLFQQITSPIDAVNPTSSENYEVSIGNWEGGENPWFSGTVQELLGALSIRRLWQVTLQVLPWVKAAKSKLPTGTATTPCGSLPASSTN
jgi:hypothetical protein